MSQNPEDIKLINNTKLELNLDGEEKPDSKDLQEPVLEEYVDIDSSVPQNEEKLEDNQIINILASLSTEVSSLSKTFDSRLSYDTTKEIAFDRLYAELDELKKNAAFEQIRPLYMDLILLFDRVENTQYELNQTSSTSSTVINLFNSISEELLEILSRREIEIIKNTTVTFDPVFQKAIGTQPTNFKDENNKVDRIVRKGFLYHDRVLRAEEVIVKRYTDISLDDEELLKT